MKCKWKEKGRIYDTVPRVDAVEERRGLIE